MIIDKILTAIFGSQNERDVKALLPILQKVNDKDEWARSVSDADMPGESEKLKARLKDGETLDDILPEAFALAREASRRVLGERPYDVQIMGAIVLHSGRISEMKTGEGKTLMCVAAAYLNSLSGEGVHIVTVNDYLAERDSAWMRPVYGLLGQSVGTILANMDNDARRAAYNCDITYGTNNELGFDYLRDNMQVDLARKVQRGFAFCIVDEIDSILIDEARTPLIISGAGEDDTARYFEVDKYVDELTEVAKDPATGDYPDEVNMLPEERAAIEGDYTLDEKSKRVSFTDKGMLHIDAILHRQHLIPEGTSVVDEGNFEYVHYFTQAVRAHRLYQNNTDYLVRDGMVQIVDEFTGRVLEGRRYGDGLHQAIEAKEHLRIAERNRTLATITFQNFFRMYHKLSGMTGTAATEAVEFNKIYKLDVVSIPTNKPIARVDENDEVYLNEGDKWEAMCTEIAAAHQKGQPVLVGTVSVDKSERLSQMLIRKGIRHEVLNAKNHAREALIIAEAGAKGAVTIATNMAGRGTDIKLGGNPEFRARKRAGTDATHEQYEAAYKVEKEKWQRDYEEVKNLGGLFVIGSERHESRRIDNQLRGRSGRQGDPGRSKFYISMDDDLMRLFGGERMKKMMKTIGMQEGEAIDHPWLNKGIKRAQQKVEERNFEIRKNLLDYDDVLNEQRTVIYGQRDEILGDDDLSKRVLENGREAVDQILEETVGRKPSRKNGSPSEVYRATGERVRNTFGFQLPAERLNRDGLYAALQNDITEKETLAGKENFNMFIRYQYVQVIDRKWLDQLEELEALRDAVYLRSYGSKNPLTEYKIDGFNLFDDMMDSIREQVMSRVFKVRVQLAPPTEVRQRMIAGRGMTAVHNEAQGMGTRNGNPSVIARSEATKQPMAGTAATASAGGMRQPMRQPLPGVNSMGDTARRQAAAGAMQKHTQGQSVTVRRTMPKVGRNDPCPCGSGKKYKNCHGK